MRGRGGAFIEMNGTVTLRDPSRVFFVSGIDTGIGKTVATGLMSRFLRRRGVDHITVKMVQTGCDGFSEDLDAHRAIAGLPRQPEDEAGLTAPQIFHFPASPALAASLEGRETDLDAIDRAVSSCASRRAIVLVEGAGGLLVPLTDSILAADFAAKRDWPLILVASGRLGAINHILLSLEAAAARRMRVIGVVMNHAPDTDPRVVDDAVQCTLRALERVGAPGALVRVPEIPEGAEVPDIDFSPFFSGVSSAHSGVAEAIP